MTRKEQETKVRNLLNKLTMKEVMQIMYLASIAEDIYEDQPIAPTTYDKIEEICNCFDNSKNQ